MDTIKLDVQTRDKAMKARDLLRSGLIPLEYYGSGVENKSFQVDYQDFRRTFRKAGGNTVLDLKVDGKDELSVLIHDVSTHPVTDQITHVDLINVRMDQEIQAKIPLEFVGDAPAVKDEGGTLMTMITEVDVKCLPRDLIHSIEVNVEALVDFNTSISIADLNVPDTVEILNNMEDSVASVAPPRVEEETETVEGLDILGGGEDEKAEDSEGDESAEGDSQEGGE